MVSPEQVGLIDAALRKVDHCDPAAVTAGEKLLVDAATKLGPKELGVVAARMVDAIDPDGVQPADEREHQERRFFHLKQRRDGCWAGDFRLTPQLGQKLQALLGPLMARRPPGTRPATRLTAAVGRGMSRSMSGPRGSVAMMRWRRWWTGCSAPLSCPSRAGSRPHC
ncbi:MAG TPA: DUF222 domain-containing protein [Microlunatus sp.]